MRQIYVPPPCRPRSAGCAGDRWSRHRAGTPSQHHPRSGISDRRRRQWLYSLQTWVSPSDDLPGSTLLHSDGRIIPSIGRDSVAECGTLLVAEDFERRERTIGDGAFLKLAVRPIGEQFHALEFMAFNRSPPVQKGGVRV